jgi:hypothetical protein
MTVKPIKVAAKHVVVEPIGQDRCQRMTERCGTDERDRLPGTAAAAGERTAAAAGNRRLRQPVLDLLEEWPVRGPFRVPQPRGRVHGRGDPAPFQLRP